MRSVFFAAAFFLSHLVQTQYKFDSMCGARVNLDKDGKLLARYTPQIPGASYAIGVKLAVDFLKACPVNPENGLPADEGCDFRFLKPGSNEDLLFIEPIVGRS